MSFDARLKKVETIAEDRLRAGFCLCVLYTEMATIVMKFLADRGVVYKPENPYVATQCCAVCQREISYDLTMLNEEERAVWHRVANWDGAPERRSDPEDSDEITGLRKWLRRRCRAADERVYGKHCYAAIMFAYRQAKELFPFAADFIDEEMRAYDEAGTGDLTEPPPAIGSNESK